MIYTFMRNEQNDRTQKLKINFVASYSIENIEFSNGRVYHKNKKLLNLAVVGTENIDTMIGDDEDEVFIGFGVRRCYKRKRRE